MSLCGPGAPDAPARSVAPGPPAIRVLHLDEHLLVVEKPSGLLAVPGRGAHKQDCLSARVQALHLDARVVHRLDEATSGLMLFARGDDMQRRLGAAFERREVRKAYVAVVGGRPASHEGRIDLPLGADWPNRPRQRVDPSAGRPASTLWRIDDDHDRDARPAGTEGAPLKRTDRPLPARAETGRTRLRLEPLSGRTHQLRVHLAALGHPILGDALYAPPALRDAAPRLLLHASELAFAHPASGEALEFASAAPF